jgi:hypothetical protein
MTWNGSRVWKLIAPTGRASERRRRYRPVGRIDVLTLESGDVLVVRYKTRIPTETLDYLSGRLRERLGAVNVLVLDSDPTLSVIRAAATGNVTVTAE